MNEIHPTAVVDEASRLGRGVRVGPYAVIGPNVEIGEGTTVSSHAVVERNSRIGRECLLGVGAVVGNDPQDLKYRGEETWVEIGDGTSIREYATINRGTAAAGTTVVGSGCLIMSYAHIAHDCRIGDAVILANSVQLGGHVEIGEHAAVGGSTPIHQFVRIGRYAFVGGGSRVPRDVPPFLRAAGNPLKLYGINSVGLKRAEFTSELRAALGHCFRVVFNSNRTRREALRELASLRKEIGEVEEFLSFLASSVRGVSG